VSNTTSARLIAIRFFRRVMSLNDT